MSTDLRVGPTTATLRDAASATLNKNGSFDASIQLVNGYTHDVTIVAMLNDALVATKVGRDVLIPFHAVAIMEIL